MRYLPLLAGAGLIALSMGIELVGVGGHPGLGRNQWLLIEMGGAMIVGGLALGGPLGSRLTGPAVAVGAASAAAATGMTAHGFHFAGVGLGAALAGVLADLGSGRRFPAAWRDSGTFSARGLGRFLLAAVQVGLLGLVIREYHLENQAFYESLVFIVLAGFGLGYFVPRDHRLLYFLALSVGGFGVILGPVNFGALLALGLGLIALSRLPVSFKARVGLLVAAGATLAVLRAGLIGNPVPGAVWPLLGSIFMFRLIIYMFDMRRPREKPGWTGTLAYFFMLPNVVFPFFPVVDFTTFRKTCHDEDEHRIHRSGVRAIFIGVTHLVLYRAVNYYFLISPGDVASPVDLGRFILATFLLYLRVSGQFHLIVGILHLFGFNLPPANNRYFLASSFTDLWRRMNIYWKDFMLKVFYYPILFRLMKQGPVKSMAWATAAVFVITWFLHSYQWFWLKGSFLFTIPDMLFWAILGLLVVVNSVMEYRHRQKRMQAGWAPTGSEFLHRALGTAGTFAAMAILWSMWSSPSLGEWASLWKAFRPGAADLGLLLMLGMSGAVVGGTGTEAGRGPKPGAPSKETRKTPSPPGPAAGILRPAAFTLPGILLVLLAGHPSVYTHLPPGAQKVIRDLRWNRLRGQERLEQERGYYENLNAAGSRNNELWELYMRRPVQIPIWETDAVRMTGDYLRHELNPDVNIVFLGKSYITNRWGMRDRDYEKAPPPGVFRIALLGASPTEGWGVGNEENFDHFLETRLNAERPVPGYERFEVLNFAVGGYVPMQMMMSLEKKAVDFQPRAAIYVAHPGDEERVLWHLAEMVRYRATNPYPFLKSITDEAGLTPELTQPEAMKRIPAPQVEEALAWTYQRTADICREHGILPVWAYIPSEPGRSELQMLARLLPLARKAGFLVIDMSDVFDGHEIEDVRIAEWDPHATPRGHQILADRLYRELAGRPEIWARD